MKNFLSIYPAAILLTIGLTLTSCELEINTAPVVNAGVDQSVYPNDIVKLSGIATDSDGDILTYSWTAESTNPTSVILYSSNTTTAFFTMPTNESVYTFTLTVFDGKVSNSDSISVYTATEGLTYTLIENNTEYCVSNSTFSNYSLIAIPATYDGKPVTAIEDNAFSNCNALTKVFIPDSIKSIGNFAFYYCSDLTSITIPDSVISIGDAAFLYCSSLTSFTIPDSVTTIGGSAFYYCSDLTSITIPDSVISIGDAAFTVCLGLTNIIVDPANENYKDINGVLFTKDGSALVAYPGGLIGAYIIPSSVINIGNYVFSSCHALTSVTIPDSVTNIGNYAFYGCSALTSVTMENATPPTLGASVFTDTHVEIHVPSAAAVTDYQAAPNWSAYSAKIVTP